MITAQPLQLTVFIEAFQAAVVFIRTAEINFIMIGFYRGAKLLDAVGAQ